MRELKKSLWFPTFLDTAAYVRYPMAALIFVTALTLRFSLMPVEAGYPYVTFYPAVGIAFYLCGLGPGVMTSIAGLIAAWYIFSPPHWSFHMETNGSIAGMLYLVCCTLLGLLSTGFNDAVRALRISEQRYLRFLEDQVEIICRVKFDGTIIYANAAFCNFFGLSKTSIVGRVWKPLANKDDIDRVDQQLALLSPSNPVIKIENRVMAEGGEERWVQFLNRGLFSADGTLLEIQSVGRDVTERKNLVDQLVTANHEIEALYNDAPCGYHSIDASGLIVKINDTELKWLGCQRDEVVGRRHISEFFSAEGRAAHTENMQRFLKEGHIEDMEYELIGANGVRRQILVSAEAVRDSSGAILMTHSVLYDISDRVQAEHQAFAAKLLSESENRLKGFIDMVPASLAMFDTRMCYIAASKGWYRDFGIKNRDLIGRSHYEVFPEISVEWKDIHRRVLAGETVSAAEDAFIRADGSVQWLKWEVTPWRKNDGTIGGMIMVSEDITQRKRQSEEVWQHANFDQLTQLPNRRLFLDRLEMDVNRAVRTSAALAVGFIDLDHFKEANDKFGHAKGDLLLAEVARRIQSSVRECDMVARYAGDEFTVLFHDAVYPSGVEDIARRVCAFLSCPFDLGDGDMVQISASIGIAAYPTDATDAAGLIRCADAAMYSVKSSGRNGFGIFQKAPKAQSAHS